KYWGANRQLRPPRRNSFVGKMDEAKVGQFLSAVLGWKSEVFPEALPEEKNKPDHLSHGQIPSRCFLPRNGWFKSDRAALPLCRLQDSERNGYQRTRRFEDRGTILGRRDSNVPHFPSYFANNRIELKRSSVRGCLLI